MARKRLVVPNKADLVARISMLHEEHKEDPKCRILISRELNRTGVTTLTGKDWNSGRLSQFIRANLPELVDKAKAKHPGGKTEAAAPEEEAPDTGKDGIDALAGDEASMLKREIRAMAEELLQSAKQDARASLERMLPEVQSSIDADLKQELHHLTRETGKLLHSEITTAYRECEQRLESSITRFKTELNETLETFRAEMRGLVKEEVGKVLADSGTNGRDVGEESLSDSGAVVPPKEQIESFVRQQVEAALKDYQPPGEARKTPGEFLPAARFVEMVESNVVWWMKNVLKPKK